MADNQEIVMFLHNQKYDEVYFFEGRMDGDLYCIQNLWDRRHKKMFPCDSITMRSPRDQGRYDRMHGINRYMNVDMSSLTAREYIRGYYEDDLGEPSNAG